MDERSEAHKFYLRAREMETSKSDHTPEEQANITAMYLEAAQAGHWKAKAHMAYRYANGIGVEQNILLAADLAKELAREGTAGSLDLFTKQSKDTSGNEEKGEKPMHKTAAGQPMQTQERPVAPKSPTPGQHTGHASADHTAKTLDLTPVRVDGKYGYITSQGDWGITPRFDAANPFFANGLAWVQYQGRFGMVNAAGEWILPAEIDRIGQFSADGLAQASKDGLVGFVDSNGEWAVSPGYVVVSDFADNGLAKVGLWPEDVVQHELSKGPKGLVDLTVKVVSKAPRELLWGFIDKIGNRVIPVELEGASDFGPNGLAAARKKASKLDNTWGYIDASGNWVIAPQFQSASVFNEFSTAWVRRSAGEPVGLIDKTGAFLIEPGAHAGTMFTLVPEEPRAGGSVKATAVLPYMHGKKWGAISPDGRWAVKPELEALSAFTNDGLAVAATGGKRGIIDAKGNWIFRPNYADIRPFVRDELAIAVGENGKLGVVNRQGDWVLKPEIDIIRPIFVDGLAAATKFGHIDRQGRWVFDYNDHRGGWIVDYLDSQGQLNDKAALDASNDFSANGPALAIVNDKFGFIDSRGRLAVEPMFDDAKPFNANGLASVKYDGKYGLMDAKGAWVCAPKFDGIGFYNNGRFSPYGLAIAKVDGKCGYIDAKGDWVIPPYLRYCHDFQECGLAWAKTEAGLMGILDARGNWVVPPESRYSDISVLEQAGVIRILDGSKSELVSMSGEALTASVRLPHALGRFRSFLCRSGQVIRRC